MANKAIEILTDIRVLALILLTLGAIAFVFIQGGPFDGGLKFGIDFSGGLRIPVLLQEPVDAVTMQEMVDAIGTRTRTFGLTEVRVTPIGDDEIYIEVPVSDPKLVSDVEKILAQQGVYQGIVDGKVAVSGDGVLPDTVRQENPANYRADWVVGFSLTTEGQKHFTDTVRGKGNYPLYMYLDRPKDAIVVISKDDLLKNASANTTEADGIKYAINALNLQGYPVPVYLEDGLLSDLSDIEPFTNNTKAVISENASQAIKSALKEKGFVLSQKTADEMQPVYVDTQSAGIVINRWDAVGLKSAPILSPALGDGIPSPSYIISGAAKGRGQAKYDDALFSARETMSVLKGGALPVQISLGSQENVPAKFGQEILRLSLLGLVIALVAISIMVAIRYRTPSVVIPIIFTSMSEMILLITIIGIFTIDLSAMAGIIAAVGVSVDAQIIITDEILKKKEHEDVKEHLHAAFDIIQTNAFVAIVAMLPLLLISGLVDIIGFATVTVIGYILGVSISRPAYATVATKLFGGKHESKHES
ncbi:MAG: hypothetical protein V1822_00095 [Candidatus Micrarchaeota archaeon]